MLRKCVLLLVLCALSFQSLGHIVVPETSHVATSDFSDLHDLLHFLGEPHTHDDEEPALIELSFSAEARQHVAHDLCASTPGLLQYAVGNLNFSPGPPAPVFTGYLPDPYLHRVTPSPQSLTKQHLKIQGSVSLTVPV